MSSATKVFLLILAFGCSKSGPQQPPSGPSRYQILTPSVVAGAVISRYPAVVSVTLSSITPGTIAGTRFVTEEGTPVPVLVTLEGPTALVLASEIDLPAGRNEFQVRAERDADRRIFAAFFEEREDNWWGLPVVVGAEFCVLRATLCPSADHSTVQLSLRFSEDLKESATSELLGGFSLKFDGEVANCSFPTELSTVLGAELFLNCAKPTGESGRATLGLQSPPFTAASETQLSQCKGAGPFESINLEFSLTACRSYESPR